MESVDESSHRRTVTTKHDISDAILSANVRQRTLKYLAIIRAQRPLATGGGTKDNQESSIVDIGTKKIHVISPTHPPTTTRDLDPDGVTSPSGELILTGRPNNWS